jgi:TonB family protein
MKALKICLITLVASYCVGSSNRGADSELLSAALDHSDIRAGGAPGFHLKAKIQVIRNGVTTEGTYTEVWISKQQWRREIELGHSRRVEVGRGESRWVLDSGNSGVAKDDLDKVVGTLNRPVFDEQLKVKAIKDKEVGSIRARCVQLKAFFGNDTECVNPGDSTLLSDETSWATGGHESRTYADYEKFGDHVFPRAVEYTGTDHQKLEVLISDIGLETSADSSQFEPPLGALELSNCPPAQLSNPQARLTPDPDYPEGQTSESLVSLSAFVQPNGALHNIEVEKSGGPAFDAEAVRTLGRWRFEPAKCNGTPVVTQVHLEVQFRRPR